MKIIRNIRHDNRGMQTLEAVLLIAVALAVLLIFRQQLISIVNQVFESINQSITNIYG